MMIGLPQKIHTYRDQITKIGPLTLFALGSVDYPWMRKKGTKQTDFGVILKWKILIIYAAVLSATTLLAGAINNWLGKSFDISFRDSIVWASEIPQPVDCDTL